MASSDPLLAPIANAEHMDVAGVHIDMARIGQGRVKRVTYPSGFRWDKHMKPISNTDRCMHAHVGFIAKGAVGIKYADGCTQTFRAPQFFSIEPGHEGWVEGNEPAVMIEFDFEGATVDKFGMDGEHKH